MKIKGKKNCTCRASFAFYLLPFALTVHPSAQEGSSVARRARLTPTARSLNRTQGYLLVSVMAFSWHCTIISARLVLFIMRGLSLALRFRKRSHEALWPLALPTLQSR